MKILMAIPCYNCAPQIGRVLEALSISFPKEVDEICIIDNCSLDNTMEVIKTKLANLNRPNIKLFKNFENYGLGGSFKQIVGYAAENSFDYLLWHHGDDQADLKDANAFISLLKEDVPDVIFGARFMDGSTLINYSKIREWGNRVLNIIFSIALNKKIFDLGSGLNIYKVNSLPLAQIPYWPDHLAFDINLLLHFSSDQFKMKFHPIRWKNNDQKSNANNLTVGFLALKILVHWLYTKNLSLHSLNNSRKFRQII